MGICKKSCLLVLGLLAFMHLSFAGNKASVTASAAVKQTYFRLSKAVFASPFTAGNKPLTLERSLPESFSFAVEDLLSKKVCKIKKKYKRVHPASTTLRPPVRDIDIIPQNIYIKETYSKPHFISPLHRFLFRLTPF